MVNKSHSDIGQATCKCEMVLLDQLHVRYWSAGQSNKSRRPGCAGTLHMLYNVDDQIAEDKFLLPESSRPKLTGFSKHRRPEAVRIDLVLAHEVPLRNFAEVFV